MTTVSLQNLTLVTNKKLTNLQDAVIRQSEKGLTITAVFLNEDSSPYDLTNKKVTFNEHKDSDKYVVDTNVKITDERNGAISYTLHPQCYAATGEAWFEIADSSGTVVDSTQNFNLKVKDAANASIYNTNYITQLDALRDQMQALVDNADGQLKQQLKTTQDQMNQKLTELGNAYQLAEQGRANAYKQAEANRDSGWSQDKQRIDNEWNQDKDRINGEWNSQKQSIQNTANSQQSSISSQWSQLKSNADSQLATIQANINALQATIDDINKNKVPSLNSSLQSAQDKLDKILASLGNFVVSSNDVNSIASDKVTEIAGNLIDPNLNNWTKGTYAQKAFKSITFDGTTNNVSYQGVSGTEVIYTKLNLELYKHYKLRFRFTPKSDIRDLSNGTGGTIQVTIWRYEPGQSGRWGAEQGTWNTTSQIKNISIAQDKFYEIGFYSDNAKDLYFGFNFNDVRDSVVYNFEISSISVVNIDNTIQSLADSSYPRKAGAASDDLFSYKDNHEIRVYEGIGKQVKNAPKGVSNWYSAIINTHYNNWGYMIIRGQTGATANNWYATLNGGVWTDWYSIYDSSTTFSKNEINQNFLSKTDFNNKVNISDSLNRGLIDQGTTWQQIFGNDALNTNTGHLTVFKNSSDDYRPYIYGYSASSIAFGTGDTRGILSVRWDQPGIMIAGGNGNGPNWARELAIKDDFANYYSKSEIDTKTSDLQIQSNANTSNLRMRCDNLETRCKNLESRCSSLETQLNVLQGQMADLLGAISISGDTLQINKKLAVRGNITTYWDGADQFIVYSGHNAKRGYFGMYDNGTFKVNG